jgi:hypothetical protein
MFEFFLFYNFPSFFAKLYGPEKILQNYISNAVGDGGRDLPSCSTVAFATAVGHGGRGPVCFQNFLIFLFELV